MHDAQRLVLIRFMAKYRLPKESPRGRRRREKQRRPGTKLGHIFTDRRPGLKMQALLPCPVTTVRLLPNSPTCRLAVWSGRSKEVYGAEWACLVAVDGNNS